MKFYPQSIPGVYVIEPAPFRDHRGVFCRHFCAREFAAHGLPATLPQVNISDNIHAYTLRGFHYLLPPHGEGKTISCLRGKVYDIIVDVRPESPTYRKWLSFELDDVDRRTIHVPPGCANAFLTLVDGVVVQYLCSVEYTPAAERGIRYNDPAFGFVWPAAPQHISQKDASHADYQPTAG